MIAYEKEQYVLTCSMSRIWFNHLTQLPTHDDPDPRIIVLNEDRAFD